MRSISIAIAAALISLSASAAPTKAGSVPVTWETCPKEVPFALPDARLTAQWSDLEWELYARNAWSNYCHGREQSFECRCADAFGGGPY